jgi:dTDP-4-dehydrorhamnose reductase
MRLRPAAVINSAAYTQVDRAEQEVDTCFRVNAEAVATLADVCRELDCPLMQVSTDYVFGADRERTRAYAEDDEPGPVNVYGRSKLAGEQAARTWEKHLIVRTCGLYSLGPQGPVRGRNFADTMLRLTEQHRTLRIVNDQRCTPSYVPHVARAMIELLDTGSYGTFHVTNGGSTTWLDFAAELFRQAGLPISLEPISTAEYGAPAPRAHFSVLDTSKFGALDIDDVPAWQVGIRDYLKALAAGATAEISRKTA